MFFKVCQKFAELAKDDLAERLKRENDWRIEYIQRKKFGIEISPFIALNVLEKAKRKETTFAERLITRKDYGVDTD